MQQRLGVSARLRRTLDDQTPRRGVCDSGPSALGEGERLVRGVAGVLRVDDGRQTAQDVRRASDLLGQPDEAIRSNADDEEIRRRLRELLEGADDEGGEGADGDGTDGEADLAEFVESLEQMDADDVDKDAE